MGIKKDETKLKCSFCGKTQNQVHKLVAGPAFISATSVLNFVLKSLKKMQMMMNYI